VKRWLRKIWTTLTYAHDPEAHRLIEEVLKRVDAIAKQAHLPVHPVPEPAKAVRHDCGHETVSFATNGDGRTECSDCYTERWRLYRRRPQIPPPQTAGPRWR
jgi:hypothetical protein